MKSYFVYVDAESLTVLDVASFDIVFEVAGDQLAVVWVETDFGFGGCEFIWLSWRWGDGQENAKA
jgi:hypothetical protein